MPPEGEKRYSARSALTIFNRAARAAGKKPPIMPIKNEKSNDHPIIDGESANENANSEKDAKFNIESEKN